jgi:hypothetical protein
MITKEELRPEIERLKKGSCADSADIFKDDKVMLEHLKLHASQRIDSLNSLLETIEKDYWGLGEGEELDRSQQGVVDAFSFELAFNYATMEVYEEALQNLRKQEA